MAKRRKKSDTMAMPTIPWTPAMQKKASAQSMARTMMETDPRHKRMEDHITKAVMAAGEKAMKKRM